MWKVRTVVGRIMVVIVLTCALLHSECDLKAAQKNMQCNLTYALQVQLGHYSREATKNICLAKGEDTVDHFTEDSRNFAWVTRTSTGKIR